MIFNIYLDELGIVLTGSTGYQQYLDEMPEILSPGEKVSRMYVIYGVYDAAEIV